jgi:hypothetical protein
MAFSLALLLIGSGTDADVVVTTAAGSTIASATAVERALRQERIA